MPREISEDEYVAVGEAGLKIEIADGLPIFSFAPPMINQGDMFEIDQ